jgi:hypothetical protein
LFFLPFLPLLGAVLLLLFAFVLRLFTWAFESEEREVSASVIESIPLSFVMFDLMVALSTLLFAISGKVELFDTFDAFISSEVSAFEHSDVSFAFDDASAANSGVENEDGILLLLFGELDMFIYCNE